MKLDVDFTDDKPVFDWREYQNAPAKHWRHREPASRPTRAELLKAALASLVVFALFFAAWVVLAVL